MRLSDFEDEAQPKSLAIKFMDKEAHFKHLAGGGQGEGGGLHGATPATPRPAPRAGGRSRLRVAAEDAEERRVGRNCGLAGER